jgi:hypothetical protein
MDNKQYNKLEMNGVVSRTLGNHQGIWSGLGRFARQVAALDGGSGFGLGPRDFPRADVDLSRETLDSSFAGAGLRAASSRGGTAAVWLRNSSGDSPAAALRSSTAGADSPGAAG